MSLKGHQLIICPAGTQGPVCVYIYISWTFLDYPDPNDEISTWLWDVMGFDNLMIHSNGTPETTETVRNHYSSVFFVVSRNSHNGL
jgi:hypothetical protein